LDNIPTWGENNRTVLVYPPQNQTSEDYRLDSYSGAEIAARLVRENSINEIHIENHPVFVPAGERASRKVSDHPS
jgi:hypothetical protein